MCKGVGCVDDGVCRVLGLGCGCVGVLLRLRLSIGCVERLKIDGNVFVLMNRLRI